MIRTRVRSIPRHSDTTVFAIEHRVFRSSCSVHGSHFAVVRCKTSPLQNLVHSETSPLRNKRGALPDAIETEFHTRVTLSDVSVATLSRPRSTQRSE